MEKIMNNEAAKQMIKSINIHKEVMALKVPIKHTNLYHKKIKAIGKMYEPINVDKIRTEGDKKLILVSETFKLEDLNLNEDEIKEVELSKVKVNLNFNNLTNQEIFDILQDSIEADLKEHIPYPSSFETAGHIAHYNLSPEQSKFKEVIGEITLAKCGNIKTVCNKTEKLHNVYRTPELEHMAGERNYEVKMKEVGVNFEFDFERVYWCSRLQKERDRVLDYIKPGQCLADIFCGVGPLAVRAAKKGAYVIANDLNPSCYEYLVRNCKSNGVQNKVKCWNMCAREAVKKIYAERAEYETSFQNPDHFYMNLPVDAIEFLDSLREYGTEMKTEKMPIVHVNCFVVADSDERSTELLAERINKVLPGFEKEDIITLHHIKNVTILMRMYCLSFKLRPFYGQPMKGDVELFDKVEKRIKQN